MAGSISIGTVDSHPVGNGLGKANALGAFTVEGVFTYSVRGNVFVRCVCIQPNGTPEYFDSGPYTPDPNGGARPWRTPCNPTGYINSIPLSAHLLAADKTTALADPDGGYRVTL